MEIRFSRHAQRRLKLYKIQERDILGILEKVEFQQGEKEIIENIHGFKFPIKIVFSVECDTVTVITSYPLKRGIKE